MFGYKHYVPVLKGKDGEFRALACLASNTGHNITPFIDIPRRDLDQKTKQPKEKIDIYLGKKAKKIHKAWGNRRQIFVDVFDLDLDLRIPGGTHFVEFLFTQLRTYCVKAIPVIGLDRSEDTDYVNTVRNVVYTDKRGVCIRLLNEDLEMPAETCNYVDDLIQSLGLSESNVHLLMDFRSVSQYELDDFAEIATDFLANLPNVKDWKSITLSSSGFPENLGGISPNSIDSLPRTELDLRDEMISRKRHIPR